jgi:hypothetical protein
MEEDAPFHVGSCYAALFNNVTAALNKDSLYLSAKIYGILSANL